ncbi:hypothetical protein [Lysinibacter cavernae]|uniref:Heme/copper-type cytochrome/quinol oxidase subunit 2 n=1 Tax=Lysinibacter cavernae TaxID=1640652 RepID=A0A7X5TV63_9MICO|nr:hypothetical protein [Lysinibacter cavernae]NIH55343.1 heme/copper-type cytochrome/quinol oxidase subunit 2 [Lysinibacter cavernae]
MGNLLSQIGQRASEVQPALADPFDVGFSTVMAVGVVVFILALTMFAVFIPAMGRRREARAVASK